MEPSASRGNSPDRWNRLLVSLDEKLQLGILDHLRKIKGYHFEEDILYLEANSPEQEAYLSKDTVGQQLQLLAHDAIKVDRIKIKKLSSPQA